MIILILTSVAVLNPKISKIHHPCSSSNAFDYLWVHIGAFILANCFLQIGQNDIDGIALKFGFGILNLSHIALMGWGCHEVLVSINYQIV
jgi:hypothetical protein